MKKTNTRLQQGYILMETLIAVIIILGLTIWWVQQKNIANQNKVAQHMMQQLNDIRSASINYYINNLTTSADDIWPMKNFDISKLITANLLPSSDGASPFGVVYQVDVDLMTKPEYKNMLVISTTVPIADARIATKAIEALANTNLNFDKDKATIIMAIQQPISTIPDVTAVHYTDTVQSGDTVLTSEANCPPDYTPIIDTSVSACRSLKNNISLPIEACNTSAKLHKTPDPKKNYWEVDSSILTEEGWLYQTSASTDNGKSFILVTLHCVKHQP